MDGAAQIGPVKSQPVKVTFSVCSPLRSASRKVQPS